MNLKERFIACREFLSGYLDILELEALKFYPRPLPGQFEGWSAGVQELSLDDLLMLENYQIPLSIKDPSLKTFLKTIQNLIDIPKEQAPAPLLPSELTRKLNPKKKSELERMRQLVDELEWEQLLDIGGGAGHLSACLTHRSHRRSLCLDRNREFQERGRKRLDRWLPKTGEKIEFIHCDFNSELNLQETKSDSVQLIAGLHGCGDLTTNIVRYYRNSNSKYLLSLGCCYQDLNGDYNISGLAQDDGLRFSKNALHLAARCHAVNDKTDMENKVLARRYRYALHFYLHDFQGKEFEAIGNTRLKDCSLPFSSYAKKYADLEGVATLDLDVFYGSEEVQRRIHFTIAADVLRGLLGRVIEIYIALDRALYLEESGCEVDVVEVFDRTLSPRNLLVFARKY